MNRDDLAKLDEQARTRLAAGPPPGPAEVERDRRDGDAHAALTAEVRRRFPGRKFLHNLADDEFVKMIDYYAAELAADPTDLDRRARLYTAEAGRRVIDRWRRDRDEAKAAAARPERERLREEIMAAECELLAVQGHGKAVACHLEKLRAKLAELGQGHDDQADEPAVIEVKAKGRQA
jgi:hypothetical protein